MKKVLAVTTAVFCLAGAALAGPTKGTAKKPVSKLTDVMVCPMTQSAVRGRGGGVQVVGQNRVHFCCAGCQSEFNKLSKAEKEKKITAALKKQRAVKGKA